MFKIALINLALLFGLLLGLETCSWSVLAWQGKAQPFLIDPSVGFGDRMQAPDKFNQLRHLDPLLGWGYAPASIEAKKNLGTEYAIYGAEAPEALRIVVSGGSTSDSFHDEPSWPALLAQKLHDEGYCVRLYAGAVAGYTSNQEMLKMLRDQHALQPHIHIAYNGVNENEKNSFALSSNFVLDLLEKVVSYRRAPFLPNSVGLWGEVLGSTEGRVEGVNRGLDQPHALSERWLLNMRRMSALAAEFDYTFIGVLQPILGTGKYTPSVREAEEIKNLNLVAEWNDFYDGARQAAQDKKYLHDFVDIFEGQSDLFVDECHLSVQGNKLLAAKMYELLTSQYAKLLNTAKRQCH